MKVSIVFIIRYQLNDYLQTRVLPISVNNIAFVTDSPVGIESITSVFLMEYLLIYVNNFVNSSHRVV